MFDHWRKHPPVHRILASVYKIKPNLTPEEAWAQGAMGPADFAAWVRATGGRKRSPNDNG